MIITIRITLPLSVSSRTLNLNLYIRFRHPSNFQLVLSLLYCVNLWLLKIAFYLIVIFIIIKVKALSLWW